MERLIPLAAIRQFSLRHIECPFFAVAYVENALCYPEQLPGLPDLIKACGATLTDCLYFRSRILEKVEKGEWLLVKREPFSPLSDDTFGVYRHLTNPSFGGFARQPKPEHNPSSTADLLTLPQPAEPGFYIIQSPVTRSALEALLFEQPNESALAKFRSLNPHFTEFIKPGQLAILSDPRNTQCTREEALLMEAAAKVEEALEPMSDAEASFLVRHRDEIESFLTVGSGALGIGSAMVGRHLESLQGTLHQLELLHQRTFQRHGHLRSADFFAERKRLLAQLDGTLSSLVRKGVGMPDHPKLKTALGISSRSLVHHWSKAGVSGGIPGYATHIDEVAKAAKYMKVGGWIGIGLGGGASAIAVHKACTEGREDKCGQVSIVEVGKFSGSVIGGVFGSSAGTAVCLGLGATTGIGGLVCGVVAVGIGSTAGGYYGGKSGEALGESLYEVTK